MTTLDELLTNKQKAEIVKASLVGKGILSTASVTFDRRFGWDFKVHGSKESPSIIFSVPLTSKRFSFALSELQRAVYEFKYSSKSCVAVENVNVAVKVWLPGAVILKSEVL